MRLLNTTSIEVEKFTGKVPPYAILSHRWEDDEVTLEDIKPGGAGKGMKGYRKLRISCAMAKRQGLNYIWIDTCCIDKTSNAELSEAINSMLRYYEGAKICYAYLSDVASVPRTHSQKYFLVDTPGFDPTSSTDLSKAINSMFRWDSYTTPAFGSNTISPYAFPAKEETQFGTIFSYNQHLLLYEMNENEKTPNLGNLETVWNSTASHPSYRRQIQITISMDTWLLVFDGFPKGRNVEWGSLQDPSFHHARIGQLFDRDYVWVVTQTMVSFEKLALWAVHNVLTYKVYPGFWGRKLGLLHWMF
jgi:hypothetical protein